MLQCSIFIVSFYPKPTRKQVGSGVEGGKILNATMTLTDCDTNNYSI